MADMSRLGLEFEAEEIEKLVATEARRRELEGDSAGVQEFYNDRVLHNSLTRQNHKGHR